MKKNEMHPHKDEKTDDSLINEPSTKKDSTTYKRNNERSNLHIELKKKKRRTIIVNTICICIILFGIGWVTQYFWRYYEYEITNDASIEEYITPINSRVSGYIKEVRFKEHEKVKAGDTLVIIDDSEFKIKVLDAEASLKDAEASKNVMISNLQSSLKNVSVSEANISEAKVRMDNAYKDYIRYENLWKEESVPQQLYDLKKADYEAYRAKYQSLINQKQANISNTEGVSKKQENADAQILRSKANLEMAKLNLSYTIIKAPYDGYVGRKNIEVGELVQAGQVLTNIIKNNDKWVIANYKEKQIANIYVGQEVNIYVDAIKGKTFKGKVTAISEATGSKYSMIPTDNAAGNFVKIQQRIPVRIDIIDLNQTERIRLRAGMMVETEAKIK